MALILALAPAGVLDTGSAAAAAEQLAAARTAALAGLYLSGLVWCGAFLVFVAALSHELAQPPDATTRLLGGVGFAGGLANAAAIGVYNVLAALVVFRGAGAERAAWLPLLFDASALANAFTGFATAVCVGGFSLGLRRIGFPAWLVALGALVGLHHLASAASLAREGFFSPAGALSASAPLGMTAWVGSVAALAWRRGRRG
jgi:hypothetical protein